MKSVLIIGMGKFGHHLCENLVALHNDVMVVDILEERVKDLIYSVTDVQIGDCTNPEVIRSLGVRNFDVVFICIGGNFQNSLEITSLVKEMGAKHVVSKANRDVHAKFLKRNGADEVIYPDRDVAEKVAKSWSTYHVFDYIEIDDDCSIYEVQPMKEWVGKSIKELNFRQEYKITVIGIKKKNSKSKMLPDPNYIFKKDEHVLILGYNEDVEAIIKKLGR